jgi:hypothetical protein
MDQVKVAADQAYGTIVSELAAPYFFEKLAAHGIQPRSEKEAADMWAAATKLHVLFAAEQEKVAAASATNMAAVNSRLDEMLAAAGYGEAPGAEKSASAFVHAGNIAAEQPEIAKAVLTLQAAAAAAMQNAE